MSWWGERFRECSQYVSSCEVIAGYTRAARAKYYVQMLKQKAGRGSEHRY